MKPRYLAACAMLLLCAACGSTVENSGAGQVTSNGQSLTAPSGSASNAQGTINGSGPSGVPGGSGGAISGSAGTNTGTSQQGLAQSGTGSAGNVGPSATGNGPGVTATTINIAGLYDPDAAAADAALGAASANPGDTKTETEAVVKYINTHGGVAHRSLNVIWHKGSVNDDASTTFQNACADWTQDHKTFVIAAGDPILDQCTAQAGGIAVQAGAIALETTQQNQKYPQDINLTSFTIDHSMLVTVNGLARQGYFSKGAKVGVVTWDAPYYHYGISSQALPALARLGINNPPVQYVTVPQAAQDISQTSASASSAVLKFRSMGIDHVILFDGPAGVNSSGILVLEWMQQANSQHYYPKHGLNSTSGFNAFGSALPPQEIEGAKGVGWLPSLEETSSDWANTPLPPEGHLCFKIMKDAGQQESGANAQANQLAICDTLFFLKQALDPVTGPLNRSTALAAINAVGNRFASSVTFGVDVRASRHDAADLVRNMDFLDSCKCFRYTSKPYNPY